MQQTWTEFIEWAIPDERNREQFRLYIKNSLNGVRNNKMLILYGPGRNGKGITYEAMNKAIGAENTVHFSDHILSNTTEAMYSLNLIEGKKLCYLSLGPDDRYHHGILELIDGVFPMIRGIYEKPRLAKSMPDFVNITNDINTDSSLIRRSLFIDFSNEFNNNDAGELVSIVEYINKEEIKQWFLN